MQCMQGANHRLQCVQVAEMKRKFPRFAASFVEESGWDALPWQNAAAAAAEPAEQLPEAGPSRSICSAILASDRKYFLAM